MMVNQGSNAVEEAKKSLEDVAVGGMGRATRTKCEQSKGEPQDKTEPITGLTGLDEFKPLSESEPTVDLAPVAKELLKKDLELKTSKPIVEDLGTEDVHGGSSREKEWVEFQGHGSSMYGWIAREDDYNSADRCIREHLWKHGDLRTVTELEDEEKWNPNVPEATSICHRLKAPRISEEGMLSGSDDYSDFSEREIEERAEKLCKELREKNVFTRSSDGFLRCPYCLGRKKQDYKYKDLLQHATGVGNSNKRLKETAKHRALAKFLQLDFVEKPAPFVTPSFPRSAPSSKRLPGIAILEFSREWSGYHSANSFERSFQVDHHGKKEWVEFQRHGSSMYGWMAREDDYNSADSARPGQLLAVGNGRRKALDQGAGEGPAVSVRSEHCLLSGAEEVATACRLGRGLSGAARRSGHCRNTTAPVERRLAVGTSALAGPLSGSDSAWTSGWLGHARRKDADEDEAAEERAGNA
ncbi:Factor of DNA methylation 1 [Nymphaea thermarum]|nr:Factor of DNA methylation 1 [Nymphaea thermarum]